MSAGSWVEVNALELDGPALNWASAIAKGLKVEVELGGTYGAPDTFWHIVVYGPSGISSKIWTPRSCWGQAGPLLAEFVIAGGAWLINQGMFRAVSRAANGELIAADAKTLQVAVLRAYVASRLGGTFKVPAQLVPQYVLHPGWLLTESGSRSEYLGAALLASRYGVSLRHCSVCIDEVDLDSLSRQAEWIPPGAVHLHPQPDGHYELPVAN